MQLFAGWALSLGCGAGALLLLRRGPTGQHLPIVAFLATWCVAIALFILADGASFPLEQRTTILVLIAVLSVVGGYGLQEICLLKKRRGHVSFHDAQLSKWHSALCGMLTLFVLMQLYRVWPLLNEVGGVKGVLTGGSGLNFRRAYLSDRLDELQGTISGGSLAVAVLGYALFLGFASLFTGAYLTVRKRFARGLAPLVIVAVYAVLMLERATFLYALVLYLAALFYFGQIARKSARVSGRRPWLGILALAGIAGVAVLQPILSRRTGAGSGDVQAGPLSYVSSGISGLNGLVRFDPTLQGAFTGAYSPFPPKVVGDPAVLGHGYGAWVFQGLAGIASRFGLISGPPPSSLNFVSTGPDLVGSTSNVYTFIIYPYYDFGYPGIVLSGIVLGFAAGICHRLVMEKLITWLLPFACLGVATLAMTFFGLTLVRDFRYVVMCLFAGLILRSLSSHVLQPIQDVVRAGSGIKSTVRTKGSGR